MSKNKINNRKCDSGAFNCNKQIKRLYASSVLGELSLTGAWVAILAARGFSLVEIGFVEMVFHITSLLFEIPSGVLADVFGRKKMLIVSTIMQMLGCLVMIVSNNLLLVCVSISFFAISYNFASGTGDALAYDSLKHVNRQEEYAKYESNQLVIYRLCEGISTLCAGLALLIGYRLAYSTSLLTGMIQFIVLASLTEVGKKEERKHQQVLSSMKSEMITCFMESLTFLKSAKKAIALMFGNSFVGAIDILLLFFLQAKLPETGIPDMLLGVALFVMQLGGVIGARVILRCKKMSYRTIFAVATMLVILGVILEHSGVALVMTSSGFITALSDDALQVRTNTKLQDMFPSEQRATLISMESFTFSVIMIVLSPLAGILFSWW
jgi:MFS family permease